MSADGRLNFDTHIDTDGFNRGTRSISGSMSSLTGVVKKFGGVVASAFAVSKLISFGKAAVEAASDLAEVQNVVDTAFGETAYKMEEFADRAVEAYGISKTTAKQTGSTYMAMAVGMGLAQDSASDMAVALTGLSADMASFYNVEQDVAATALNSVFTGETETLKRFGIVMTDANLQAFALSQGITKSTSAMTQAEKVQLRYAYVMQQTGLAQGDFAKTSDSWANQTRILTERWKEFSTAVGQVLMNVVLPVVKAINQVLSILTAKVQAAYKALAGLFGWEVQAEDATDAISTNIDASVENQEDLTAATEDTTKAAKKQLMGFDEINKLSDNAASSTGLSSSGVTSAFIPGTTINSPTIDTSEVEGKLTAFADKIKSVFDKVQGWYNKNFAPIFKNLARNWGKCFDDTKGVFKDVFSDIKSWTEPLKTWFDGPMTDFLKQYVTTAGNNLTRLWGIFNKVFGDIWKRAVKPIVDNFLEVALPMITEFGTEIEKTLDTAGAVITDAFNLVWDGTIAPVLEELTTVWTDTVSILASVWDEYGAPIFDGIRTAFEKVGEIFANLYNQILKPICDKIIAWFDSFWNDHLAPLVEKISTFVAKLVKFALDIYNNVIAPLVNWLIDYLAPIWTSTWNVVQGVIDTVFTFICDIFGNLMDYMGGFIDFITGVFSGDWEKAWDGIVGMFKASVNSIIIIAETIVNAIVDVINALWNNIYQMAKNLVNGLGGLIEKFGSLFGQDWGFSIPDETPMIPHLKIPRLATGTVVPPSQGEFLAMLGDNKREAEVVSPLSTMKQALSEVLSEYGGTGGDINLTVELDGTVIYKSVVKQNRLNTKRTGVNALA